MKLLGRANWWAPAPLRRIHERWGLHEAPSSAVPDDLSGLADELVSPRA
jgi:RND superfamily putative drug exporter